MVETGSPQFVMAGNVLSATLGIICGIGLVIYILKVGQFIRYPVGSIAPIFRCTRVTSYKSFARLTRKHIAIFKVEKYWTQKLYEWKESHIAVLSGSRRSRGVFRTLKKKHFKLVD
ncbi:hypothetical protein LXL04_016835 [Taraxacum kok-saghyz]